MTSADTPAPTWRLSPALPIALAVSAALGVAAGSAFLWSPPDRAWNLFLAGFLWTLISAAGTTIARCFIERIRRGEWGRGLLITAEMTFPLTTIYLIAVALTTAAVDHQTITLASGAVIASKPDLLAVAPICYAVTLVVAFVGGPLFVMTSPFRQVSQTGDRETRRQGDKVTGRQRERWRR